MEVKTLMAEWLEQVSQWHELYCHDLEVMSLNPSRIELGVRSTSVLCCTWTKNNRKNTENMFLHTKLTPKVLVATIDALRHFETG